MTPKPFAAAPARNAAPILEALLRELKDSATLLEIGTGTGQHAIAFAPQLAHLNWQTSDLAQAHDGIRQWIRESGPQNVLDPIELDVLNVPEAPGRYEAVYSSNTAHIMSDAAVRRMFELVGDVLEPDGVFCLYGPFGFGGRHTAPSNAVFDQSLRSRNPVMGVRDLDQLDLLAQQEGLQMTRNYAMPSNNMMPVWHKRVTE